MYYLCILHKLPFPRGFYILILSGAGRLKVFQKVKCDYQEFIKSNVIKRHFEMSKLLQRGLLTAKEGLNISI